MLLISETFRIAFSHALSSSDAKPDSFLAEEEDEDNMEEIDTANIIDQRSRGKQIDWAEAEEKLRAEGNLPDDDDEEEDDNDFEDPDADNMEE